MSPSVADLDTMSSSMRCSPLALQVGRIGCLLRVDRHAASTMTSRAREFPLIVHWKLSWPRATVPISRIHAGKTSLGFGTERGNELAMANGASSARSTTTNLSAGSQGAIVTRVCVFRGHVNVGGSDGDRDFSIQQHFINRPPADRRKNRFREPPRMAVCAMLSDS